MTVNDGCVSEVSQISIRSDYETLLPTSNVFVPSENGVANLGQSCSNAPMVYVKSCNLAETQLSSINKDAAEKLTTHNFSGTYERSCNISTNEVTLPVSSADIGRYSIHHERFSALCKDFLIGIEEVILAKKDE